MVVSRNLGVGKVFATSFAPDREVGFRLAVAGSKGEVQIWDTSTNAAVRRTFAHRVAGGVGFKRDEEVEERLVGVNDNADSSSSDDEGEEEEGHNAEGEGEEDGEAQGWESMDED